MVGRDQVFIDAVTGCRDLASAYEAIASMDEGSPQALEAKKAALAPIADFKRLDRVRAFTELARIELLLGRPRVNAAYLARQGRWLGRLASEEMSLLDEELRQTSFSQEADCLPCIFGEGPAAANGAHERLRASLAAFRQPANPTFERVDDRRAKQDPALTVVSSLYNVSGRLGNFLSMLSENTLLAQPGLVEIVLIDSGSTDATPAEYEALKTRFGLPIVCARTATRETIQTAWNQGIALARGRYLALLGVDEAVTPDAFERLCKVLDDEPSVDWAQGSADYTEVDETGRWLRTTRTYDRRGYDQRAHILDCCYISYVGAVYRRSVHDRVGFYDPSFRAAGDNEFKNRALPFIRTKTLDETLGAFRSYPGERASQGPLAELEDLRAWYLFRTVGGCRYLYDSMPTEQVEEVLFDAFAYRKTWHDYLSSDVDFAATLAEYLAQRSPVRKFKRLALLARRLRNCYRQLELLDTLQWPGLARHAAQAKRGIDHCRAAISAITGRPERPGVFDDNRYEQHHWVWWAS